MRWKNWSRKRAWRHARRCIGTATPGIAPAIARRTASQSSCGRKISPDWRERFQAATRPFATPDVETAQPAGNSIQSRNDLPATRLQRPSSARRLHRRKKARRIRPWRPPLEAHQSLIHHVAGEQRSAEQHDHERRGGFQSAHEKHSHSRLCLGEPTGEPTCANGKRSNGCNRDRRTETHHKRRCDTNPEQALRQRKDKYDDRARAWTQSNRHDRGKPAPEPMAARQLLRLGRVSMPPGGGFFLMVVVVAMCMLMMMCVPVLVDMIMMVVIVIRC